MRGESGEDGCDMTAAWRGPAGGGCGGPRVDKCTRATRRARVIPIIADAIPCRVFWKRGARGKQTCHNEFAYLLFLVHYAHHRAP